MLTFSFKNKHLTLSFASCAIYTEAFFYQSRVKFLNDSHVFHFKCSNPYNKLPLAIIKVLLSLPLSLSAIQL